MPPAFYCTYILWFLSEMYFHRMRPGESDKKGKDKNSLSAIWITLIISISAGAFIYFNTRLPIIQGLSINYAGLAVILTGIAIRYFAVRTLGKFFTVNITVKQDHKIIDTGLYKYIRHPSYTGSLISFVGLGLSLNNWASLLIIIIPVFISFIYRIGLEEKMLSEAFPLVYNEYKKHTYRLLPFIY